MAAPHKSDNSASLKYIVDPPKICGGNCNKAKTNTMQGDISKVNQYWFNFYIVNNISGILFASKQALQAQTTIAVETWQFCPKNGLQKLQKGTKKYKTN